MVSVKGNGRSPPSPLQEGAMKPRGISREGLRGCGVHDGESLAARRWRTSWVSRFHFVMAVWHP